MKDIIISARRIRLECFIALSCFLTAFILNIYAVVHYDRSWVELFSQLGFVVVIAVVLYGLLTLLRLIVAGVIILFRKQ